MNRPNSPLQAEVSQPKLEAANTALETLEIWRKHRLVCKQCRYDPSFCKTSQRYEEAFEEDLSKWRRTP